MLIRTLLPELFVGKFKVEYSVPYHLCTAQPVFLFVSMSKNYNSQITKAENFVDKVDKLIS